METSANRIRDPIHGFITFSDKEKEIINWNEFQRLRYIKQLALTYYVYPGAMHTRFEHSLGVMEVASRIFDRLLYKEEKGINSILSGIGLSDIQARRILRLAALLHDIGHLPFSHGGEVILPEVKRHEDVTIEIIKHLRDKLKKMFSEEEINICIQLITGEVIPEINFLKDIISGQVDADRIDYLLRDSYHCGVGYGHFDYHRLIEELVVIEDSAGGLELAIDRGGIHSLEALILARYYMFTQVFCHRTRRIYDIYLKEFMKRLGFNLSSLTNVLEIDDVDLINEIRVTVNQEQNKENYEKKYFAERIYNRNHHSVIYESSDFADAKQKRKAKGIYNILTEKYNEENFVIDLDADGTIHKFFVEGEDEEGVDFYVIHKYGRDLITKESKIIEGIRKKFHVVRIYVDNKDEKKLKELRDKCIELEKEVR